MLALVNCYSRFVHANNKLTRNVGQCPTWWSLCRIQVAPSVQRRKVWLTPTNKVSCSNDAQDAIPVEIWWGCPKPVNRSQPLVDRSSPYCGDMRRRYCCLTSFFPVVDMCFSCEDIARQSCAMVRRWPILAIFCVLHFQRAARSTFQTCILNSH